MARSRLALAALIAVALASPWLPTPESLAGPSLPESRLATVLTEDFDAHAADVAGYRAAVREQDGRHPEVALFSYVLPILAYTSVAARDPEQAPRARAAVDPLLAAVLEEASTALRAPDGRLDRLASHGKQGVWLGQVALALGCWRRLGGDDRYDAVHSHLTNLLADALDERKGRPLDSYPGRVYPFDTLPALLALRLRDLELGTHVHDERIRRHLLWIDSDGTDPASGLPYSRVHPASFAPVDPPRGCDLSWRVALMTWLDRDRAQRLYPRYRDRFWLERGFAAGFAETEGGGAQFEDADSGPIVLGIGTAATGLGLGAVRAAGDEERFYRLEAQALAFDLALDAPGGTDLHTGFLFGDAALFYAVTWEDWDLPPLP